MSRGKWNFSPINQFTLLPSICPPCDLLPVTNPVCGGPEGGGVFVTALGDKGGSQIILWEPHVVEGHEGLESKRQCRRMV